MNHYQPPPATARKENLGLQDFRMYALTDSGRAPALLAPRTPREACEFVAQKMEQGEVPLPRVVESYFGPETWNLIRELTRRLDVIPALWVVAAGRFFDEPILAFQGIVAALSASSHNQVDELGSAFYERMRQFYVKRYGHTGSLEQARILSSRIQDLLIVGNDRLEDSALAPRLGDQRPIRGDSETPPGCLL